MTAKNARGADQFALIAASKPSDRTAGLVVPEPPVLPPTSLPVEPAEGRDFFTPLPLRDTPEAVRADLEALKKTFAPFLRRLAPALPMKRATVPLESFSWRIGTDADRADFFSAPREDTARAGCGNEAKSEFLSFAEKELFTSGIRHSSLPHVPAKVVIPPDSAIKFRDFPVFLKSAP
jgi:hypothetical protein